VTVLSHDLALFREKCLICEFGCARMGAVNSLEIVHNLLCFIVEDHTATWFVAFSKSYLRAKIFLERLWANAETRAGREFLLEQILG
jgi:hypothetical protein